MGASDAASDAIATARRLKPKLGPDAGSARAAFPQGEAPSCVLPVGPRRELRTVITAFYCTDTGFTERGGRGKRTREKRFYRPPSCLQKSD